MHRNYFVGDTILVVKGEYKKHRGTVKKMYDKYMKTLTKEDENE